MEFFNSILERQNCLVSDRVTAAVGMSELDTTLSNSTDIDSDEDAYDSCQNSPFRRYLNSQQNKRKVSDANEDSETRSFSLPKMLDFSRSQKVDKTNNNDMIKDSNWKSKRPKIESQSTWLMNSAPNRVDDLCIHGKKIDDLTKELADLVNNRKNKILVVSGPAGIGKSTSVKIIANLMIGNQLDRLLEYGLSELDNSLQIDNNHIVEFNISSGSHMGNSSVEYFTEFLDQCKLLTGLNEKCVIIEELPNLFHKETHHKFQQALLDWIQSDPSVALPPLVLLVTEFDVGSDQDWNDCSFTIDNFVKVETVLGYKLLSFENYGWRRIRFNRVAKKFLKNALKRTLSIENVPVTSAVNKKVELLAGLGDLRNAINELEFWYKFQYDPTNKNVFNTIDGKESGIDTFHSIGKIVYGSKHPEEEFEDFKKRNNLRITMDRIDPNLVTAVNISTEVSLGLNRFNLCCLENYSVLNPIVDEKLCDLMDVFGVSDMILQRGNMFNQSNIAQNTSFYSCYGLRTIFDKLETDSVGNTNFKNKKLKFSRDSKFQKKLRTMNIEIEEFKERRMKRLMLDVENYTHLNKLECATIDGYYQSSIFDSFKFKLNMYQKTGKPPKFKISRIGGNFTNSIVADENFVIDEDEDNIGRKASLKDLEENYFGIIKREEVDDEYYGGEYESDPIEDSDDEKAPGPITGLVTDDESNNSTNPKTNNHNYNNKNNNNDNDDDDDDDDVFSDDSIVLRELSRI